MVERLRRALPSLIGFVLFALALAVLRRELYAATWPTLVRDLFNTPLVRLSLALLLTACNYAVLTGYDFLAFAYIGKRLSRTRIVLASFLAYAIANNIGFAMLSGTSVRYRFYTRWGITAEELSRIVFSYAVTFWLGLLLLGGLSLAVSQLPSALAFPGSELARPFGWILATGSLAYPVAALVKRAPLRLGRVELPLPPPNLAVAQLLVSVFDWALAAAVLYVLLPASGLSFLALLGAFVIAQLLLFGFASLIAPAPHEVVAPTPSDLDAVSAIMERQTSTYPYLVFLRDKAVLFDEAKTWGRAQGYAWFSLGMAPLSGFEQSPVAPLWSRLGSFVYEHGEALYHFQGLRAYKEKFHPQWEPRYLVYPGGFRLPRILADVAALVAGGYRKVLLK